jgi:hypothetical protein
MQSYFESSIVQVANLVERTKGASTSSIVVTKITLWNLYVQIILQLKELTKINGR